MGKFIAVACWVIAAILVVAGLIALFSGNTAAQSGSGESGALAAALLGYLLVGLGALVAAVALVVTLTSAARRSRAR